MPPRWSWDFEDEKRAGPAPAEAGTPPGSPPPGPPPNSRAVQVRRRRLAAAVALLAIIIVAVIGATSSSMGHRSRPATQAKARIAPRASVADIEAKSLAAVGSVRAYTPFVKEGSSRVKDIALTFDDGPGPYTVQLLKVLERYHVKATFFEIGKMLQYFGAATVRQVEDGDVIGDHTETHPFMATLSAHDQFEELFEQLARIELAGGRRPTLFRPPYGSFNSTTMRELAKLHLLMVLWSVDTDDYLQPGVSVIVQRALEGARAGAIILMHDGGGTRTQTIEALPQVITRLRAEGYRLVTIPRLLLDDPPPAGQPLPPNLSGD